MDKSRVAEEIILKLMDFVKRYSLDSLFIVGGWCRSKIMNDPKDIKDIDVASAYPRQGMTICGIFASEILKTTPEFYHRTGTGSIVYEDLKIEFQNASTSSYMKNEEVRKWMRLHRIIDSPLMENIYGRDFTINSIIFSLKNGEFYDLTKKAIDDIERKTISSIIDAHLLVKYNPIVILRAIRFSVRYDFRIDSQLRKAMNQYYGLLNKTYSKERISREIEKILQTNSEKGLEKLKQYNLMSLIVPDQLRKYLKIKEKKN